MPKIETNLCRECGKDRVLSMDGICIPCYAKSNGAERSRSARSEKAQTTIEKSARELLAVLERNGDWDEGCFYYNGKADTELPKVMQDLADALEKAS